MNRGTPQRKKSNKFSQKTSTLLIATTSNALIVLVKLLVVLEDALVQLSADFATGGKGFNHQKDKKIKAYWFICRQ